MVLYQYYKQLLLANNVQALDEEVWKKQPAKVDSYALLGLSAELVKFDSEAVELTSTLHPVESVNRIPPGFTETETSLFYARIMLGEGIRDIKGMSGGPVFAFHQSESGELIYWLTALQSRWLPESRYIAACPTKLLGHFIESLVARVS